jgi:hypothetical protein
MNDDSYNWLLIKGVEFQSNWWTWSHHLYVPFMITFFFFHDNLFMTIYNFGWVETNSIPLTANPRENYNIDKGGVIPTSPFL